MPQVFTPRVRETTLTEGAGNIVLGGAMRGSLTFAQAFGEIEDAYCDVVVSYDNVFSEFEATLNEDGELVRGTCWLSMHADGVVNSSHLNLPPGLKTIILVVSAHRAITLNKALRFDISQSLTADEKNQLAANLPLLLAEPGTRMMFQQAAAPIGWTKEMVHNDKGVRLVTGTPSNGGSLAFSTVFNRTSVDAATLMISQLPAFTPSGSISIGNVPLAAQQGGISEGGILFASNTPGFAFGAPVQPQTFTGNQIGGGQSHLHTLDLRIKYVDFIIGVKD